MEKECGEKKGNTEICFKQTQLEAEKLVMMMAIKLWYFLVLIETVKLAIFLPLMYVLYSEDMLLLCVISGNLARSAAQV